MATILEFRAQSLKASGVDRLGGSGSAEIVLFPGVRYERWSGDETEKPKSKKSRRRDRLELED
jgi:hypothetical protein